MLILNLPDNWQSLVAQAADLCLKPYTHSIIETDSKGNNELKQRYDVIVTIESRDKNGNRLPEHDLELEIYISGNEFNITLTRILLPEAPILWHGQHPVWIDGNTGKRLPPPKDYLGLESFARRLRAVFC